MQNSSKYLVHNPTSNLFSTMNLVCVITLEGNNEIQNITFDMTI